MIRRTPLMGAAAGLVALGLIAGSGAASAQTKTSHGTALKGTIQTLSTTSFLLKPSTGSAVTVNFNVQTRVEKIVAGTTADLTSNAHVKLQLQSGTTTVTAVTIEPTVTKPAGSTTGTTTRPVRTHPTKGTKPGTGTTTGRTHTAAGGQVVSLSGSTLTLKGRGGTTTTYTLASNVKITKVVKGTTNDLAQGETVQVFVPATGAAREITILAS